MTIAATLALGGGVLLAAPASAKVPKPKATPQILVRASSNPVVEVANSVIFTVVQVESNPANAGKAVTISSTQLFARCTAGPGTEVAPEWETFNTELTGPSGITIILDNDGNATVVFEGADCAPGTALIDASLDAPPFNTAVTKLVMEPPQVTPPGIKVFPNPEVEVGDGVTSTTANFNVASEADFVFMVETNPVYAEQGVTLTSDQLTERCGGGSFFEDSTDSGPAGALGPTTGIVVPSTVDNDGNAEFSFYGSSCAAGKSTVIAEVLNGGPTYSTQATILPPAVTV
jgi:hypothetical protein